MEIALTELTPRTIALLKLPRMKVSIRMTAGTPEQRRAMLRRMDLAMQRGWRLEDRVAADAGVQELAAQLAERFELDLPHPLAGDAQVVGERFPASPLRCR